MNTKKSGAFVKIFYLEWATLSLISAIFYTFHSDVDIGLGSTYYYVIMTFAIIIFQIIFFLKRGDFNIDGWKAASIGFLLISLLFFTWIFGIDLYALRFSDMRMGNIVPSLIFSFLFCTIHAFINICLLLGANDSRMNPTSQR
jgi:hypothetical protein